MKSIFKKVSAVIGDLIIVNPGRYQRSGKIIKVLPPKHPSPGGLVVDNETHTFYVAPWDIVVINPINNERSQESRHL